ncbi:PREDICTED: tudor domain-containing protein 7 isoform X2 [Dinoponera quadriceps]|nr:PREDICTED: tudor domain-containing protein 7 isoform X2 [Dinoponera quadriceps]XP_014473419.1 PREDICTED: tudor domain-containing protein 7 isoform X2 [Dinoponera quadriceps]XP_014473420.1 PREDICTED: tudor domain-containing protein 7 isoform X2 [Dinoponera quadriceps]XP_014473421.1 PREDICTED: tudor domain-containing protein 7 isoform X2 [Dinoponera quadriceps]XP_014473422.1 PREDICTED: tudor domain-containing protein 7 isoform X2 [Dinoponera quadriceps]
MDQNEIVKILRSCLISCKGGVKLDNLKADYHMITGESLPYRNFGFSSIEAFIRNISDITVTSRNGELYVDAVPSRTTAHLTKLISHQVQRRKTRRKPQAKKWSPHRYTPRGYLPGFKNYTPQPAKYTNPNPPQPFTRSTPGKSNLYTDFSRPTPLMENIVQCPFPLPRNNEKPRFALDTPQVSPSKRLRDKANPNVPSWTSHQSFNKPKTFDEGPGTEISSPKAVPQQQPVISSKPKTGEQKPSKLSDRLKITFPLPTNNNGHAYTPVIPPSVPQVPQFVHLQRGTCPVNDPRKELIARANALDLQLPMYKMYTKKERSNPTKITIYASVKVGAHTFHTFPEDARSEEEAEKIAARLALTNLAKESSSPEVTTVDVKLVKERILMIITRHHSGVFMHQLPAYYNEQYGEALPSDWQRIIEECADINKEKGVGNSTILCRSDPTAKRPEVYSPSHEAHHEISSISSEKIRLSPIGPVAPDKLKIPEATLWNVYPTCVISTVEVWVRLVDDDYNDNFIDMTNEMAEYYRQMKESVPTSTCAIGDFYAIFEDEDWHRVQCIDFEPNDGLATVHFIDEGYEDQYKCDVLLPLDKKFCVLPAQAVRVALQGLEELRDYSQQTIAEIENQLMERVFCVKVHSIAADEEGTYAVVSFFDTSGEDDIDVNNILFEKIMDNIAATSKSNAGQFVELYVTNIDEHGKVYAQLNSVARTCLLNLMNNEMMAQIPRNVLMSSAVRAIDFTKMYFVQLDSQWYRARVTDVQNESLITVFLVDLGRTVTALRANLLHMDKISKVLQSIPPQATQVFLHNIDQSMYGERFVVRFNELVSDTDLLIAKVVRVTTSGVPVVQIFKRVQPSNMLASINESLIHDEELTKSNEDGNNNIKPKKRLERKNSRILESGKLNPPMISDIGQYFDVHVSLAAHPGHFIVQPLDSMGSMKTMMRELQKCCDAYEGPELESVGEGKLYAGKCMDNYWYRVYVTNIINDNMISVYFCDFGDVTIVQRSRLQPLKSEFLELPYQAVKAKLVGIQPMNTDWTVEDCVRFRDLVLCKNFVSIVVESMFDHLSPVNGTVLGLRLIDVSTDKDIFIDKMLVEENRAKCIEGESIPLS